MDLLEELKNLRDSITSDQRERLERILFKEEMSCLGSVLSSANEDEAKTNLSRLKELLSNNKLGAIRVWKILEKEQREVIFKLIDL